MMIDEIFSLIAASFFCHMADEHHSTDEWDAVVLTARNEVQCEIFQQQLGRLRLIENNFCRRYMVLADDGVEEGIRIGSGGATLNALLQMENQFGSQFFQKGRVLLLHSGGLSQRIPHVALTGKAFMLMPDGHTLLEHKLRAYKNLLHALSTSIAGDKGFVFVASADVLEHFPSDFSLPKSEKSSAEEPDLLLVAHLSSVKTATQHGVFVPAADEALWRVLQKPSESLMRQLPGAILPTPTGTCKEMALTDSCYLISHKLVEELLAVRKENGEVLCELCCYRDFLCPLGTAPDEEKMGHFRPMDQELFRWQQIIWQKMHTCKAQLLHLGPDSFFHFGTANELLHHFLDKNSTFLHKFIPNLSTRRNFVNCQVENPEKISCKSFAEWCRLGGNCTVEDGCILSGVHCEQVGSGDEQIQIRSGMCLYTVPIRMKDKDQEVSYVTVLFHRDDDLKLVRPSDGALKWFGHPIDPSSIGRPFTSLWDCPLFSARPTAYLSLRCTLHTAKQGPRETNSMLSIAEVLTSVDIPALLRLSEELKN